MATRRNKRRPPQSPTPQTTQLSSSPQEEVWSGVIRRVPKRFRWLFAVLVLGAFLALSRDARCVLSSIINERVSPIPSARSDHFSIGIALLQEDSCQEGRRQLIAALQDFASLDGADLLLVPRRVTFDATHPHEGETAGHASAQALLVRSNCDLIIWGEFVHPDRLRIFWTARDAESTDGRTYSSSLSGGTPPLLHGDIRAALCGIALTQYATYREDGRFLAIQLRPFIDRLSTLLAPTADSLDASLYPLTVVLANGLCILGDQTADDAPLWSAIKACDSVISRADSSRSPDILASLHNARGRALRLLGDRGCDVTLLRNAVDAFSKSLVVRPRTRDSMNWAITMNNLGNAHLSLAGSRPESCGKRKWRSLRVS